jgi:hypothetical protein
MKQLREQVAELWYGRVALRRAFWEYAILYGFFLALFSTIASLALVAGGYSAPIVLFFYLLPAPYNLFMVIAVWRSAARYEGPQHWAVLARGLVIIWAVIATLA